jgi:hypothetical protein
MAQTRSPILPGLPRDPLSPTEQLEALRRVQAQAEQRVKLGLQLFKAAEAHATQQQTLIEEIKSEQQRLRAEVQEDVARSLHTYDQWMGRMDEDFTRAIKSLETKIEMLEAQWSHSQERMAAMMRRAEALLQQSQAMLEKSARAQQPESTAIKLKLSTQEPQGSESDEPHRAMSSPLAIKLPPAGIAPDPSPSGPLSVSASSPPDEVAPPAGPPTPADVVSYSAILRKIREVPPPSA